MMMMTLLHRVPLHQTDHPLPFDHRALHHALRHPHRLLMHQHYHHLQRLDCVNQLDPWYLLKSGNSIGSKDNTDLLIIVLRRIQNLITILLAINAFEFDINQILLLLLILVLIANSICC